MRAVFLVIVILFSSLQAEDLSKQIWGNFIMNFPQNDTLRLQLDIAPKTQISGEERWRSLNLKPAVAYYPAEWIDLTAEAVIGYTDQTNEIESVEITPRIGIRIHLLGSIRHYLQKSDVIPLSRFNLSAFFRYEYRNLWYNDSTQSHQSRFRVRLETKTAFNHKTYNQDDTYYLFADVEQYFNVGKDIEEVFSHKLRMRIGPGYRYDDSHRFETLIIYDQARDTLHDDPQNDAFAFDVRYIISF